ncbi:hypothetical protein BD560DRAFT_435361 [Blakeslea trispora]|nr:hypothetical protein BD560DRAFT_435361 [Blakeslea trispora]
MVMQNERSIYIIINTITNMDKEAAARIQSSNAKSGQDVGKGSFPARAQSAADRNANQGQGQGQGQQNKK